MKGLYGRTGFQTELREREEPRLDDYLVRLRVNACGLCGTDLHFLRDMQDWTPMGHEISAEVIEVGARVSRVKKGQLVICEDVTMCGACDACKTGQFNLCRNGITLNDQPGMSDELIVHENMLNVFDGIDPIVASMVEPLAVGMRGVQDLQPRPLSSLAIFGMGAIGLFAAAYARFIGVGRIAMFARNPASLRNRSAEAIACAYGVDEIHYTANENYMDEALSKGSFDSAILAAPPTLAADAMNLLGYGGRVMALGVSFGANTCANLNISDMVFNKKQLLTSIAEPALNFPLSIQMIRSGHIDASRIITHTLPIVEHKKIAELYACDSTAVKTVILCN